MITFYSGTGSQEIQISEKISDDIWVKSKSLVLRLLKAKGQNQEAKDLEDIPFSMFTGTNWFGDEFNLLKVDVDPETYVKCAEFAANYDVKRRFLNIAEAFKEIGYYVRFIVAQIGESKTLDVSKTDLKISDETIDAIIADAESLIISRGPSSAVDRMHAGLLGFLKKVCKQNSIPLTDELSITAVYKNLRDNHPLFSKVSENNKKILGSFSTIIDAVNYIRNHHSLAHPNQEIVDEADSWLVINSIKTMLNYFNKKFI